MKTKYFLFSIFLAMNFLIGQSQATTVLGGNEWRQLTETTNFSWNQVNSICGTDGITACAGSIGGVDFNGWIWATPEQVGDMFSIITPHPGGIEEFSESNPAWAADVFSNYFQPTITFMSELSNTKTVLGIAAGQLLNDSNFNAATPRIFYNIGDDFGVVSTINSFLSLDTQRTSYGVWLFRPAPVPLPAALPFFLAGLAMLGFVRRKSI